MKNFIIFIICLFFSGFVISQNVAINNDGTDPDNSAMLDIKSNSHGLLIPRMTESERNLISAPATGLLIYQTDNIPGFYCFNGGWTLLGSNANYWTKNGSDLYYTAGNIAIGTSNPAGYKINISGSLNASEILVNGSALNPGTGSNWTVNGGDIYRLSGNVGIGRTNPGSLLDVNGTVHLRGIADGTGLYVSSSGNVGIKTTDPGEMLELSNSAGNSVIRFHRPGIAEYKIGIGTDENLLRIVNTNGGVPITSCTKGIIINPDGNVGIGTMTPVGKLHIAGSFSVNSILQDGGDRPGIGITGVAPQLVMMSGNNSNGNHGSTIMMGSFDDGSTSGNHKHWSIGTAGINSTFFDIGYHAGTDLNPHAGIRNYNGTTFFTILNSGNIGIGKIDPEFKLDVNGQIHSRSVATDNDLTRIPGSNEVALSTAGDGFSSAWIWRERWSGANFGIFHNNYSDYIHIVGNSLARMSIDLGSGNIGVGISNPSYRFSVVGNAGSDNNPPIYVEGTTSSSFNSLMRLNSPNIAAGHRALIHFGKGYSDRNTGYIGLYYDGDASNDNRIIIGFHSHDDLINLKPNGNLGIGTTNPGGLLSLGNGEGGNHERKFLLFESGNSKSGLGSVSGETRFFIPDDQHLSFGILSTSDGTTWTETMRLTNNGKLGLHTTSPDAQFHLVISAENENNNVTSNGIYIFNPYNSDDNDDAILALRTGGSNSGDPFISFDVMNESGWSLGIDNSDDNKFKIAQVWDDINNYTRFTIKTSGEVGIGTSNPACGLDVNSQAIRIQNASSPASNADGYTGEIRWDANYIYICTAGDGPGGSVDTWKRAPLTGGY